MQTLPEVFESQFTKPLFMFDQKVLTVLRGWASETKRSLDGDIANIYVFGSLVKAQGRAFSYQNSDIDLLIETKNVDFSRRIILLQALLPHCQLLEELLFSILGRTSNEAITSVTLVTNFELEQGIHKDRNSRVFYASKSFLPLTSSVETVIQIGNALENDLVNNFFEAWFVMANAQAQRNKFLRKETNGKKLLTPFDSLIHTLPKDLLRNAYGVYCLQVELDSASGEPPPHDVDDVAKGLSFLRKHIENHAAHHEQAEQLLNLLESNRPGAKGEILPVPVELILFAWEMLSNIAQNLLLNLREKGHAQKNKFAAQEVLDELIRYQVTYLHAVDLAIELYRGGDLINDSSIPVRVTRPYIAELYEIDGFNDYQLEYLAGEWPQDIRKHLLERKKMEGSDKSEGKVGFAKLNISLRGLEKNPELAVRPLTYWVTQQFNKDIAVHKTMDNVLLRAEYAERLLCTAEDYQCECPSSLYLELAVVTSEHAVTVIPKSTYHSAVSRRARHEVHTCGPEIGFVWKKHVAKTDGKDYLDIRQALYDGLTQEFNVLPEEVVSWNVNCFAVQSIHLNASLLGVVQISLKNEDLEKRLAKTKYHEKTLKFLRGSELLPQIEADFGKWLWHPTALLRLTLADEYLKAL